ncbi:MAG: sensor histidine kinase N-terminal domain-containing protein [Deltaproteobacteria bacterium]|nr:sensor histidine kinase N-terminal domain-containing protein [Deltaproteobacteria bacterium]
MTFRVTTLRWSLLLWLLLPLGVAVAVSAVAAYRGAIGAANLAYDRTLLASARSIAERVTLEGERLVVDLPFAAIDPFEADNLGRIYYKVTGLAGELASGYDDFPAMPPRTPRSEVYPALVHFYDGRYRGEPIRAALLFQPVAGEGASGMVRIHVGETLESRRAFARSVLLDTLLRQGLLVLLVAVLTLLAVHRALAPLLRLREEVAGREPDDLRPFEEGRVHRELRPMVAALNLHTDRLGRLLDSRRRFITDASHQLRTPLAALKTQAQMALRGQSAGQVREAVQAIHGTTDEMVRLANQLLALARAEPGTGTGSLADVDLAALARQVCLDWSPEALGQKVDLAFEEAPARLRGDAVMLRELLANLVDNALRYGGRGGAVTVRVGGGERPWLEVEDRGPGIPPELRARVFERFYRVPGQLAPGTGLGLAIVREIARQHGAGVELREARGDGSGPPGLVARVNFPAAGP